MTNFLSIDSVEIGYSAPLRTPINLEVAQGEIVAILGPSGCGKSTFLSTLLGSVPAISGSIELNSRDITQLPIHQRGIGMVFQDPVLFPHLSVARNIGYGLKQLGKSKAEISAEVGRLLQWVGLEGYENRKVHQLSGGQAQRVALARALAPSPQVVLLDEPFSALDEELRDRLSEEIAAIMRKANTTAIYVTHMSTEAHVVADRVVKFSEI